MDLTAIWDNFSSQLRSHLARKVPGQDVEDLLQEVFLALLRNPPPADVAVPAWAWRLVRHRIADYYRGKPKAAQALVNEPAQTETYQVRESEAIVAGWLRDFVQSLPEKYSRALLMADFEGGSMKKIATELGLSLSGAKSRVQRARRLLAIDLQACCAFYFDDQGRVEGWQGHRKKPNACC